MVSQPEHKPGRNDPCWCGSGKKYKSCHMRQDDEAASKLLVHNNLIEKLDAYALQREFKADFESVYEFYFGHQLGRLNSQEDMIEFQRALDYFIHDYRLPNGKRIVDRFATEQAKHLSAEERTLINGWLHSRLTAFEVIAVDQGVGMRLRDLVSGEEFDVREKSGTRDLNRWEILVSRLMRTGDHYEMGGATGMRLPARYRDWLRTFLTEQWSDYQFKHPESTYEDCLHASSHLMMRFIEEEIIASLNMPPKVMTAEGDESEFCQATFDVLDYPMALAGLRGAAEFIEDEPEEDKSEPVTFGWSEEGESLGLLRAHGPAFEHKPAMGEALGGFRNLGHLSLTHEALTLEVTSRRRLKAGRDLLTRRLGNAIRHRADDIKSIAEMLAQMPKEPDEEIESEETSEELEAMQADMEAQFQREWLDQKIPALEDQTPREAVKTFGGRVRVIRLLKDIESSNSAQARKRKITYDFIELKRELGITDQELIDESRLENQMKEALDAIFELANDDQVDEALTAWRAFRAQYPITSEDDLEFSLTWDLITILDETILYLGYRLAMFQRHVEGIALLEEYLMLDPDDPDVVRAEMAEMRAESGDTDGAIRELNELIEQEPDSFAVITTLAAIQRDLLNRPDDAIATLKRGLETVGDDDVGDLYEEIVETHLEFNQVDEAEEFWHAMNGTDEESERDYLGFAKILLKRNDLDGARVNVQKIEQEPARKHWLGVVEARAGNFDKARELWAEDLREPQFDFWAAWFVWMDLHIRLREFDLIIAKIDLRELKANATGYFYLALANAAKGNWERAAELVREGRMELKQRTRRTHWASTERETRVLANELGLSSEVCQAIGI